MANQISKSTVQADQKIDQLMQPPPWLQALRNAMSSSINPGDINAIMQAQVEKAKAGDMKAASFVMNQAHRMMQAETRPVSIIQNNFYGEERPDTPSNAEPSSDAHIRKLRSRAVTGQPLVNEKDGPRRLTDEDERQLRRQQDAEAEGAETHVPELDAVARRLNGNGRPAHS